MSRWTLSELEQLRAFHAAGLSDDEIAAKMPRHNSASAVRGKRHKMRLTKPNRAGRMDGRCQGERGAVIEGRPPDEALRSRCRQLAHDLGRGGELSPGHLKHKHGYTDSALASLLEEGVRWFERTPFGVKLTEHGRCELLGGKGAA